MLGKRLARRGVGAPALAALFSERVVSAVVPASVVRVTIETANHARQAPVGVATLTEGVVRAMFLNKIKVAAVALLVGLGVTASGAALLTRPTVAAQPARYEATGPEKGGERPAGGPAESYVHIDRGREPSATHYKELFGKTLGVLAQHFEQITFAQAYTGRIEARQPLGKRTAVVVISAAEEGGYLVRVRVLHEAAGGKPVGWDVDLERVILRRLAPGTEDRPEQTMPSRVREPVESEDDQLRRLLKEVDELRERVRALERRLPDRVNRVPPPAKDGR
jgi:hypothetical protein